MRCFGCTEFFWRLVGSSVVMVSNFDELYISSYNGATNPWLHHIHFYASLIPQSLFNNIQQIHGGCVQRWGTPCWFIMFCCEGGVRDWRQNHATSSFLDRPHCHMIDCWWHFRSNAIKFLLGIHKITIKSHWHPIWWISNRKSMAYHH